MEYFNIKNIKTLDDLKKLYKEAVKIFHPDVKGGSTKQFQDLQNEYDELVNVFLNNGNFTEAEAKDEIILDEAYKQILNILIPYNVDIELIGSWIWVSGNTYPIRQLLKENKFMFAPLKKMWYINTTGENPKNRGKTLPIDKIRSKYGSKAIKPSSKGGKALNGVDMTPSKKRALKKQFKKLLTYLKKTQ